MTDLTEEILRDLYLEQCLTETEIAKRYDTYQVKISRLRKRWGIQTLGKTGRMTKSLPDLTPRQQELLVGSLLGDGHLFVRSSPLTAGFSENHSLKQADYTRWKASLMEPYTIDVYDVEKKVGGEIFKGLSFRTRMCTQLRPWFDLFYSEGSRQFPDLHKLLTPFALAVWYMDDGSLTKFTPSIAFGLDLVSLKRAFAAMKKLGLRPTLYESSKGVSIRFPGQSEKFFDIVRPHIPECMSYKLPVYSKRKLNDLHASRLTPQKAHSLRENGLTYAKIAKLYGVSENTARRRVSAHGKPLPKMGRPKKAYTRLEAEVILDHYDTKVWIDLDPKDQDEWAKDILGILLITKFPYDTENDVHGIFRKLQCRSTSLDSEGSIRPQSHTGISLCKRFFPNRYLAISTTAGVSAYEAWHTPKLLERAIRMQLKYGDPVIPHRVLRAITAQVRTPTIFRPIVAKYLYTRYASQGTVWDPCAGYGGRLLGALSAGVKYIGTDVDPETLEGNHKLAEAIGHTSVDLHLCPAEEFECPPVDFVFTSPPYFDREQYAGGDQSWKKYSTLDNWITGFMTPVMQTAHKALHGEGHLAINIADLKQRKEVLPLVARTIQAAESVGFKHVETLKMPLSKLNRANPWEPVLIFR